MAHDLRVQPDHIYVIPPNTSLTIANAVLKLQPRQATAGAHRSIAQDESAKYDSMPRSAIAAGCQELDARYSEVLINVTSFFRNAEAFTQFRQHTK